MAHSKFQIKDEIAVLSLDNQPANLFTEQMGAEIADAFDRAVKASVRAMIVRAEGDIFCGGVNVALFQDRGEDGARTLIKDLMPVLQAVEDAPFPVIAAVQGLCLAAGLELALVCDIVIAADSAAFAQVEALIGATTFGGGAYRLAERCGSARAAEICFTADFYSAEQFERWNIVNHVVPAEALQEGALALAKRLAKGPTAAHAITKKLLRHATAHGVRSADNYMAEVAPPLFVGHDMPNAVSTLLSIGARRFRAEHATVEFVGN